MAIRMFQFGFFGSFQCRLPTEPDLTGAGRRTLGWTFDLGEAPFDRIIRLSNPVSLRNGLVDGWADTKVNNVMVDHGTGLESVSGDPLLNQTLSFGTAKFDTAAGKGPGKEALIDFTLSAGAMLQASAKAPPQITTAFPNKSEEGRYKVVKEAFYASIPTGTARRAGLEQYKDVFWPHIYCAMGTVEDSPLNPPKITAKGGVLQEVAAQMKARPASGQWLLHIDFYHFDGDTLVGQCNGWITAYL